MARRWIAGILIVLVIVLSTAALVVVWANRELTNTDQFVALVSPLAADPAVRDAIGDQLTDAVATRIAAEHGASATAPLDDVLRQRITAEVQGFLGSERFTAVWREVLRRTHEATLALFRGNSDGAVSESAGRVVLDLAPFVAEAETRLADLGVDVAGELAPAEDRQIVLFSSPALATAVDLLALLGLLALLLPVAAIGVLLLALLVAQRRGRALAWAGFGLALMLALLVVGTVVAGRASVAATDEVALEQIGAALLDTVLASLRTSSALLALAALGAAAIGLLFDRRRRANQARW